MRKLTSREIVLVVVVLLVALIGLSYGRRSDGATAAQAQAQARLLDLGEAPVVQIARLELPAEAYDPDARNLFAYYTPPAPPPPVVQPVVRTPPPVVEQAPVVVQAPVERRPIEPPRPVAPKPNYKYIGFLGPKDDKIAVLESGKDILLARLGEVVGDRFKIVEFKYEALVFGYTEERFKDETAEIKMSRK